MMECYFQSWISALLTSATQLTSLTIAADGVPWTSVMGLLSIRQLEISMCQIKPWLRSIAADLSFCSCLESLKIVDIEIRDHGNSMDLPDLFLHNVATLQSVDLIGWYPKKNLTLPPGCLLRMVLLLDTARWDRWQRKAWPTSMLYLSCMDSRPLPTCLQPMSSLQYLALHCRDMQNQDLAALQHIPHVYLGLESFSTFQLTIRSGSWQSFQLHGAAGFSIEFSDADSFVRDTRRFHFEGNDLTAEGLLGVLQEACIRQNVTLHHCVHRLTRDGHPSGGKIASLSNVKMCRTRGHDKVDHLSAREIYGQHDKLLHLHGYWPDRAAYPELYRQSTATGVFAYSRKLRCSRSKIAVCWQIGVVIQGV